MECKWLFSKEAVETEGVRPFLRQQFWDVTNGQDWGACEGVQRGASSRGYRRAPLSPDESTSGKFVATVDGVPGGWDLPGTGPTSSQLTAFGFQLLSC